MVNLGMNKLGFLFNVPTLGDPNWIQNINTNPITEPYKPWRELSNKLPAAFKFTFRLYDSKGIIRKEDPNGLEFTHIVYLED